MNQTRIFCPAYGRQVEPDFCIRPPLAVSVEPLRTPSGETPSFQIFVCLRPSLTLALSTPALTMWSRHWAPESAFFDEDALKEAPYAASKVPVLVQDPPVGR
ncbi:hypothetical protein [Streptomyces sp. AC558_RSS880]|uniref:hypothetical protein n=1 Tax=Streptomyces sp. AC558_RSS880 TaxID=2823687 RepID=UPI0020B8C931|nr:hypothetical protein [Streptomyces sp. AC558_RSS880]